MCYGWLLRFAILFTLMATVSAGAQGGKAAWSGEVRILSSFVGAGEPVPESCRREAEVFARILVRYPRPASWRWVLICDRPGWQRFLRFSGRQESDPILASTDLAGHTTYVNGGAMLAGGMVESQPRQILLHELAHIHLGSQDEVAADKLAREWQP